MHFALPHLHLTINRLTKVVAWSLGMLSIALLIGLLWFSYTTWFAPMNDTNIPEDKLSQKRELLRVKDFEAAKTKLEAKQKLPVTAENPFE